MIVLHTVLPHDLEYAELIPIGDTHVEDELFDEAALRKTIAYILAAPNRYTVLNGDLINNALKNSKSDIYTSTRTPLAAAKYIADLLRPLVENKRILGMTTGNHEERTTRDTSFDPSEWIAMDLGIIDRYVRGPYILFISLGTSEHSRPGRTKRIVYSFYIHHGFGGGKKQGSKLNNVISMNNVVDADIYVMSHLHDPASTKIDFFRLDYQNQSCSQHTRGYLLTNACLKYGGYAQDKGYTAATVNISKCTLNGQGKKGFTITI